MPEMTKNKSTAIPSFSNDRTVTTYGTKWYMTIAELERNLNPSRLRITELSRKLLSPCQGSPASLRLPIRQQAAQINLSHAIEHWAAKRSSFARPVALINPRVLRSPEP
jgi:hypothetical protein